MKNILNLGGGALLAVLLLGQSSAQAHIDMVSHESRAGGSQKAAPCEGRPRGSKVYTYRPGETINITVNESVGHPGYFRIAFDADGEDDFVVPSGTEGTDGDCAGDKACGPGKADYCNSPAVMWDNLSQHEADALFGPTGRHTWSITLPDIECDNCTLQVIQMMNDFNYHPAAYPADDIYYRCIDIVLSKDAQEVNDTPVTNNGMACKEFDPLKTGGAAAGGDAGLGTSDGGVVVDGGASAGGGGTMGGGGTIGGSVTTDGGTRSPMTSALGGGATSGAGGGTTVMGGGTTGGGAVAPNPSTMGTTAGGSGTAAGGVTAGTSTVTSPTSAMGGTSGMSEGDDGCSASRHGRNAPPWLSMLVAAAIVALRTRRRGSV